MVSSTSKSPAIASKAFQSMQCRVLILTQDCRQDGAARGSLEEVP